MFLANLPKQYTRPKTGAHTEDKKDVMAQDTHGSFNISIVQYFVSGYGQQVILLHMLYAKTN